MILTQLTQIGIMNQLIGVVLQLIETAPISWTIIRIGKSTAQEVSQNQ